MKTPIKVNDADQQYIAKIKDNYANKRKESIMETNIKSK